MCQTLYATTSCHPGGSIGAEPVLTSFQIKALALFKVRVNGKPVKLTSTLLNAISSPKAAVNASPVTSTF